MSWEHVPDSGAGVSINFTKNASKVQDVKRGPRVYPDPPD